MPVLYLKIVSSLFLCLLFLKASYLLYLGSFTVTTVPVCSPITCDTYMSSNGAVSSTPTSPYYVDITLLFICDAGYEVVGDASIVCGGTTQPGETKIS